MIDQMMRMTYEMPLGGISCDISSDAYTSNHLCWLCHDDAETVQAVHDTAVT